MKIEGWFRKLVFGRIEIFLKVDTEDGPVKLRASGKEDDMFELVDWFEGKTGLKVESPSWRRVRTGPKPMAGQTSMIEEVTGDPDGDVQKLRSGDTVRGDTGGPGAPGEVHGGVG